MSVVLVEDPDLVPLCPHCGRELSEIVATIPAASGSSKFKFGKRTVYACPMCRKALGVSERKGFWAG
ncbi:MAG: hypothetical protein QNJ12_00135 [Ilumatobacter sp.]|uniref:hypothetical protein n=1 Tax=Ilumatobacter sp. TaxID=1967498 RepID=UPI0026027F91|nr:hypothetical protein [Ilumatobacter sp.]MDJ0767158.1 hypothetical protein [Ilumatobacter sp.]